MGLFDALFGNRNQIPTVTTILPDAARQEIMAGRLPILNTDKLFLKRGLVVESGKCYQRMGGEELSVLLHLS